MRFGDRVYASRLCTITHDCVHVRRFSVRIHRVLKLAEISFYKYLATLLRNESLTYERFTRQKCTITIERNRRFDDLNRRVLRETKTIVYL